MIGRLRRWLAGPNLDDLDDAIDRHPAGTADAADRPAQLHLRPTSELLLYAACWLDGDDADLAAALRDRAAQFRAEGD